MHPLFPSRKRLQLTVRSHTHDAQVDCVHTLCGIPLVK